MIDPDFDPLEILEAHNHQLHRMSHLPESFVELAKGVNHQSEVIQSLLEEIRKQGREISHLTRRIHLMELKQNETGTMATERSRRP